MWRIKTGMPSHTFLLEKKLFGPGQVLRVYVAFAKFSSIVEEVWGRSQVLVPDKEAGGEDLVL